MPISLSQAIKNQRSNKNIEKDYIFKVNGTGYSGYVISWNRNFSKEYGAASATFRLHNPDGKFNEGGDSTINVGDTIELIESYQGDSTNFKTFYGLVNKRAKSKSAGNQRIILTCMDYISYLQNLKLDLETEGTKVKVENETLTPHYLDPPNDNLAQLFDFNNNSIATDPPPTITFKDKNHTENKDRQDDGFEIYYSTGQLKLGSPLNVRYNYDVLATYFYYVKGKYAEDIIEEIIKQPDGYGNYLFGETTQTNLINNHLRTNYEAEEGSGEKDTLVVNSTETTLTVETTLTQDYNPNASGGEATTLHVESTDGFPAGSSSVEINGDIFTYTGKTSTTLTGVSNLNSHSSGDYAQYETTYSPGQVWYLSFSNLITDLSTSDFTLPSGSTVSYHSKRGNENGSWIILDSAISTTSTVTCNTNYSFKTLQATGIQINRMVFRERQLENRFQAIQKINDKLAPNYIVRTQGDNKIWASYLSQSSTADYDLDLIQSANYMEDQDLYTRVKMWAKNKEPTNIMFGDSVDYTSEEEASYIGTATNQELDYIGQENSGVLSEWAKEQLGDPFLVNRDPTEELIADLEYEMIEKEHPTQNPSGYQVFTPTSIANQGGRIILGNVEPTVYINQAPIDNKLHQLTSIPVKVKQTVETITKGGGKSKSVSTHTYYYYKVIFAHSGIEPSQPIYLYDNQGILRYTIDAYNSNMDYSRGVWDIPGTKRNDVAEVLSAATYWVMYSDDKLTIDYDNMTFKIHKSILPEPKKVSVQATFEYWAIAINVRDIDSIVDGRKETQLQLEFFSKPPTNFHLATVDLGAKKAIQKMDIVPGYFKPEAHPQDVREFEVDFTIAIKYSNDGTNFYSISSDTDNIDLSTGDYVTLGEGELGSNFEARYLKFTLQDAEEIDYGKGRYVVAINEFSAYGDIVIGSEAKLIPQTELTSSINPGDTVVNVKSTGDFTEPASGQTTTAYIGKNYTKPFTYSGLTSTSFTGCTVLSGVTGSSGDKVTQSIASDTTVYDSDNLLPTIGDKLYTKKMISDRNLYLQSELDTIGKGYLEEFVKNHNKMQINIIYAPYLKVGQTVSLTDSYTGITNERYFIESINATHQSTQITLAKYPA